MNGGNVYSICVGFIGRFARQVQTTWQGVDGRAWRRCVAWRGGLRCAAGRNSYLGVAKA